MLDIINSVQKYIKKKETGIKISTSLKRRWDTLEFIGNTGNKMTIETRKKMSDAKKGKMPKNLSLINANKKGAGNPQFGKPTSEKQKESARLVCANRDYKDPEYLMKHSLAQKGEKGSNWKGGVTPLNKLERRSYKFRLWRESVFERDNYTCKKCNIRSGILHPHHILNFSQHEHLRFDVDNGITLCAKDHREFHSRFGKNNNNKEQLNTFLNEHQ